MDWREVTERIARIAEEIQKTAAVLEDLRQQLVPVEEQLILLEKELDLISADLDSKIREELALQNKKPTEKMVERALLTTPIYRDTYEEYMNTKAKKAKLTAEIKKYDGRLTALQLLIKLAELDSSYLNRLNIADKFSDFPEKPITKKEV